MLYKKIRAKNKANKYDGNFRILATCVFNCFRFIDKRVYYNNCLRHKNNQSLDFIDPLDVIEFDKDKTQIDCIPVYVDINYKKIISVL